LNHLSNSDSGDQGCLRELSASKSEEVYHFRYTQKIANGNWLTIPSSAAAGVEAETHLDFRLFGPELYRFAASVRRYQSTRYFTATTRSLRIK